MRFLLLLVPVFLPLNTTYGPKRAEFQEEPADRYTVACYYFPNYHPDARNAARRFAPHPFFPNATVGWHSSPRYDPDTAYVFYGYPCTPVIQDNTPLAFEQARLRCRSYLDHHPGSGKIVILNAWNEWTEGSYLEPDTVYGMQYLEALQRVFGQ